MKISICEICYHKDEKLVQRKYRRGFNGGLKLDLCEEHKDFGGDTQEEFTEQYLEIIKNSKM